MGRSIYTSLFPIIRKMVSFPTFLSLPHINPGFANTEREESTNSFVLCWHRKPCTACPHPQPHALPSRAFPKWWATVMIICYHKVNLQTFVMYQSNFLWKTYTQIVFKSWTTFCFILQIFKKCEEGTVNNRRTTVASCVKPRVLCLCVPAFTAIMIIGERCIMGVTVNLSRG